MAIGAIGLTLKPCIFWMVISNYLVPVAKIITEMLMEQQ
jgi:hypothetical protein